MLAQHPGATRPGRSVRPELDLYSNCARPEKYSARLRLLAVVGGGSAMWSLLSLALLSAFN